MGVSTVRIRKGGRGDSLTAPLLWEIRFRGGEVFSVHGYGGLYCLHDAMDDRPRVRAFRSCRIGMYRLSISMEGSYREGIFETGELLFTGTSSRHY